MVKKLEKQREQLREDEIREAEQGCGGERNQNNQHRISDGLLARRPDDMLHFGLCFFYILSDSHMVLKNPSGVDYAHILYPSGEKVNKKSAR